MDKTTKLAFKLISLAGDAKSMAFEALAAARKKDFKAAEKMIQQCDEKINDAHQVQYQILTQECSGTCDVTLNFMMVHAQDHVMTTVLAKDLVEEQILLRKEISEK
ncbi:PTS lactose/cellobiose transporter subunit IIA [[Clostridium] innocuum]|nr:PTS lactose/cellobiose transporter subunit IIA [[Clostridium] innocuum]